jgi:hypothetical protein
LSKLSLSGAALALAAGVLWLSGEGRERPHTRASAERAAPVVAAPALASRARHEAEPAASAETAAAPELSSEAKQNGAAKGEARRAAAARKAAPSTVAAPDAPAPSTLGQELKLLAEAQAALRADAPQRALALVAQHRASFPNGVMKEERQGIEALASCALGRDYRAQAEQFLKSAQSSPLAARVRKACGIEP